MEMSSDTEAQAAITGLNDKEVGGRRLKVDQPRPREDGSSSRGGGGTVAAMAVAAVAAAATARVRIATAAGSWMQLCSKSIVAAKRIFLLPRCFFIDLFSESPLPLICRTLFEAMHRQPDQPRKSTIPNARPTPDNKKIAWKLTVSARIAAHQRPRKALANTPVW